MKKLFLHLGTLYVLISMFLMTDLNPLLYWGWYRDNVNALLNVLFSIHPNLPLAWFFSVFVLASFISSLHCGGAERKGAV